MRKRVLVMATTFPRWRNDTTPGFVYQLSDRLGKEYEITLLAPHHHKAKKQEWMGNLDVRRFAYFKPESLQKLCYQGGMIPNMKKSLLAKIQLPLLIISEFFNAAFLIKKKRIGAVHAHWILPQGMVGVLLKKIFSIPLMVTVHGSDLFPLQKKLFVALQGLVVKNADLITVNSRATEEELLRRFPKIKKKIRAIPMGVDIAQFRPRSAKRPSELRNKKIILFVGRLSDQKGVQYLIEAMPAILKKHKDAVLLIIGEGPYKAELQELSLLYHVKEKVKFLGALPSEKIALYHSLCDLFVLPALSNRTGTEALGLSLLEAMSSGCAVVGTRVGGVQYAISHNANGVLVNQQDPMQLALAAIDLLSHPAKARQMGKKARIFIEKNYDWESIAKRFSSAYKEAFG